MVKIRLRRMGAKKAPFYRIVVADSRYPRDGRFIEEIGFYNPTVNPTELKVDVDRAQAWIKTGAQPTETVSSCSSSGYRGKSFHMVGQAKRLAMAPSKLCPGSARLSPSHAPDSANPKIPKLKLYP